MQLVAWAVDLLLIVYFLRLIRSSGAASYPEFVASYLGKLLRPSLYVLGRGVSGSQRPHVILRRERIIRALPRMVHYSNLAAVVGVPQ